MTATVAGIVLMVVAVTWHRIRWVAAGVGTIMLLLALPRLDLLFVAAYPTSFFVSPTEFAATAITHGARLYARNCIACHGTNALGDGPTAQSLPVRPADLTADHLLMHSGGDLYWFISHGFTAPDGTASMPGFAGASSSDAIWHLIDYLHAHNAGEAMRRTGHWPHPVPMPQFDAECANGTAIDLDDLRGHAIRIILISEGSKIERLPTNLDLATIVIAADVGSQAISGACIAMEPQVWSALAIILGSAPAALVGTQLLVDQQGWIRAIWRPGDAEDWTDSRVLATRLREISDHPLTVAPAGGLGHQH
jgi:mono/diheme cytochrome c family protein